MRNLVLIALLSSIAACSGDSGGTTAPPAVSAASVTITSGQNDTAFVDSADAVSIHVLDANGHSVANQAVSWVITSGGGSLHVGSTVTDQNGASQNAWTLGAGDNVMEARAMGTTGTPLATGSVHAYGKAKVSRHLVLYAVPQSVATATVSSVTGSRIHMVTAQAAGVTIEPWNADSIVYAVGDSTGYPSGTITLNLIARVADFGTSDSAAVPNATINWVVNHDAYSQDPKIANSAFGLSSNATTTDAVGNTVNGFSFDEATLSQNGGYFYVEAKLADSSGALVKEAKFYIINWQLPVWVFYWDGKAAIGGVVHVQLAPDTPLDIAAHGTFPLFEGADQFLAFLGIDHVTVSLDESDPNTPVGGCTVNGTVVQCNQAAIVQNPRVNIFPRLQDVPPGVLSLSALQQDSSTHSWVVFTP